MLRETNPSAPLPVVDGTSTTDELPLLLRVMLETERPSLDEIGIALGMGSAPNPSDDDPGGDAMKEYYKWRTRFDNLFARNPDRVYEAEASMRLRLALAIIAKYNEHVIEESTRVRNSTV